MRDVMIIDTGLANVRSVQAALERVGARPRRVAEAAEIAAAEFVVLPGVGAFGPAMAELHRLGLAAPLRQRALSGGPLLGVCLGMQLLCEGSDEMPGVRGLAVLPVRVARLPAGVRTPHMGWTLVSGGDRPSHAYFAHSFAVAGEDAGRLAVSGWQVMTAGHPRPFVAGVQRGDVLACQFHPELSGDWGQDLLDAWLNGRTQEVAACLQ
ncbi:MAG: imidazole glycerol phosphate synthase subunit HisH [bacterium]